MMDHNTVCWQYDNNIWKEEDERFEKIQEFCKTSFETVKMLQNELPNLIETATSSENIEKEIDFIREKNKELKQEIEQYTFATKTTQTECHNLKTDKEVILKSLKDTHRAFLLAKSFYKKELDIYYTIESFTDLTCVVYLQFFSQKRNENSEYYVRLLRYTNIGKNELLEMMPQLPTFQQLSKRLGDTNDVLGFLCYVRHTFLAIKQKKEDTARKVKQ